MDQKTKTTTTTSMGAPFEILDEVTLCVLASGLPVERVRELAGFAKERSQPMVEVLVERGGADETVLLEGLARQMGIPFLSAEQSKIADDVLSQISPAVAINHKIIPIENDDCLKIACSDPFDWRKWDDLSQILNRPLAKVLSPRTIIERMLKANYGLGADTVERMLANRTAKDVKIVNRSTTDLSEMEAANEPTVVNLVNKILTEAIRANATDVHFEPYEDKYRVRYRIDGILEDVSMPVSVNQLKLALVSRIKIMSNLDITEKRLPQDGRSQVSLGGQDYDLRVSILPGAHGEAVVIRLQSRQMVKLDLEMLGFEADEREKISNLISRPHGLILVTGPTGSGKTTSLYTCLSKINQPGTKIITIEDPIEYRMEGILQMQIHEEIGFDFSRALRSILRHDPDVILVGEIRDRETADIAIRASLTGHLVFATLHTNDAASAITRLIDIGVEPFLVASSLQGILAQRLVRKVCPQCARDVEMNSLNDYEQTLLREGYDGEIAMKRGHGCERCRFTGYRGRRAIGEILLVSSEIRRLVQQRETADRIKDLSCQEGMTTLRRNAFQAVATGMTTMAEALRVTQEDF
jgi:general secretion pathway protein E/type IV pilus assembly protein PilB